MKKLGIFTAMMALLVVGVMVSGAQGTGAPVREAAVTTTLASTSLTSIVTTTLAASTETMTAAPTTLPATAATTAAKPVRTTAKPLPSTAFTRVMITETTSPSTSVSAPQYVPPAPVPQSEAPQTAAIPQESIVAAYAPALTAVATTQQTTTTTQYVPPVTAAATTQQIATATTTTAKPTALDIARSTSAYEIMGQDYTNRVLAGVNRQRGESGAGPAGISQALSATSLEQAKRMSEAGREFHSAVTPGCESVGRFPCEFVPAETIGALLAIHASEFLEPRLTAIGVGAIRSGNYVYIVLQG